MQKVEIEVENLKKSWIFWFLITMTSTVRTISDGSVSFLYLPSFINIPSCCNFLFSGLKRRVLMTLKRIFYFQSLLLMQIIDTFSHFKNLNPLCILYSVSKKSRDGCIFPQVKYFLKKWRSFLKWISTRNSMVTFILTLKLTFMAFSGSTLFF